MDRPLKRLAVIRAFRAEKWPSMDLCADQLLANFPTGTLTVTDVAPPFQRLFQRVPVLGRRRSAYNADRLFNRQLALPRRLSRVARDFDGFHVADHSYAAVVHSLPAERTGVYCHDLDAFRCLLDPPRDPRPWWFRAMARRILTGLQKAAVVFYSTEQVREQILQHRLIDAAKLVHAPYGVSAEFTPKSVAAHDSFVLHVGSCIPRKRIDVLLDTFARLRAIRPGLSLVQVGGEWTTAQSEQIRQLGIGDAVRQQRGLSRTELADLYRRASLVLQTSEAEGFGLPVLEALACGAVVLASDIPAMREVGGPAAVYLPVGDAAAWAATADRLLANPSEAPPTTARAAQAARFSWANHAAIIANSYRELLDGRRRAS